MSLFALPLPSVYATVLLALGLVLSYTVYGLVVLLVPPRTFLRQLPGPPTESLIWGNMRVVLNDETIQSRWASIYGPTFATRALLGRYRLCTLDHRAIGYILSHSDIYPKPGPLRYILGQTAGEGLLVAEGDTHKRQRRIMNPSFSPGQIRELTPIFFEKAQTLRDIWLSMLAKTGSTDGIRLDVYHWMGRAALDIIGLTGFGYTFNALFDSDNELSNAFANVFESQGKSPVWGILQARFWLLRLIPTKRERAMAKSLATMRRVGMELVIGKKRAVQTSLERKQRGLEVEKSNIVGRDLLSTLIRANMAADLSPAHRLTDEEVLAQISTFLIAGHETTSTAVTWTIYSLSQNLSVQTKLREELAAVLDDTPTMDDLNALPYLDMVVRESLRLHSPVPGSGRIATQEDTIPLATPFVDRDGVTQDSIRIRPGDQIGIPILAMNRRKEFWGEDADEFRPERWTAIPPSAASIPGVFSHIMTFINGPRACIGYRFSIIEMKALLFSLVRAFEFSSADPNIEIGSKTAIVSRPFVKGQAEKGLQLPLLVKAVVKSS